MNRILKGTCNAVCLFLLVFALIPLVFSQILNLSVLAMLLLCAALFLYSKFYTKINPKWRTVCNILWIIGATVVMSLVGAMLGAAYFNPPSKDDPPQTVVVLGAKITDDQPSLMLARRLDAALNYMLQNPGANAVVCGGLGEGEAYTESDVMKRYLVKGGVEPERVFEENASTNTGENLRFAADVIRQNGLDTRIVVCTDGFHQLRAWIFGKQNGLTPTSISSSTPLGLLPMYYVREWVGLAKALILGT